MEARDTKSGFSIVGRIERRTHDVSTLESEYPDWHAMSEDEKLAASREVEPADEDTFYNVTTDDLHEYFVDNLDPGNNQPEANLSSSWLGLGTDAASGTATTDTDLNNRVYQETVTDHVDNGKELLASTFLDSSEGNGETFDELGLFTGDPTGGNLSQDTVFMMNHATFSAVTKDNTKTVTFDVTLTFSDV